MDGFPIIADFLRNKGGLHNEHNRFGRITLRRSPFYSPVSRKSAININIILLLYIAINKKFARGGVIVCHLACYPVVPRPRGSERLDHKGLKVAIPPTAAYSLLTHHTQLAT